MARWLQNMARTALNAMRTNARRSSPSTPQKLSATPQSGPRVAETGITKAPRGRTTPLTPKEALRAKKLEEQRAWEAMLDEFLKNPSTHQRLAPYA